MLVMPPNQAHAAMETLVDVDPPLAVSLSSNGRQDADEESAAGSADEETPNHGQHIKIDKKQAQRDIFQSFLQARVVDRNGRDDGDVDETPKRQAIESTAKIIDRARDYQQELFERARSENIIAVLDTGSGKTLIACLLIKHVLADELVNRAKGNSPKIVVFMANSVHLVQQQARVLACNLATTPHIFYGNDGTDSWKRAGQEKFLVVCTPAILQQCLDGALTQMEHISLLVFDEAHHAKKNHPYSRIIRSYYLTCPDKPRLFAMTASPVDSKGNIDTNAMELEHLLHSKIVTTSDMSILSFAPKPEDVIWAFQALRQPFETELHQLIYAKSSFVRDTKRGFVFSRYASSELGVWCANQVWKYIFGHFATGTVALTKRYEQSKDYEEISSVEERDSRLQSLQEASLIVQSYDIEATHTQLDRTSMSSKVLRLYDELMARYALEPNTRAIVFVEQRLTAYVLNDCFRQLKIPNLRSGVLLGTSEQSGKQEQVLEHFRAGLINLVFATSVADEGIDIPQCNLCVRFDLYKSPIQYMQSRGRARMKGSIYVHLIEEGNAEQESAVQYAIDSDIYIKEFCQRLPADRLLGQGTRLGRMIKQDAANKSFRTSTGAICDFGNSLLILTRFAASLAHVGALTKEIYEEEIDEESKQFRYIVRLPPNSETGIKGARGEWRQNKQLAKRSAAFNCCYLLRGKGVLDDNLYSVFQKVKPLNLNSHLAVSGKRESYPMLIKPAIWSKNLGRLSPYLYACVLSFEPQKPLRRPMRSLVILTRERLPSFPVFPIFVENNVQTDVLTTNLESSVKVTLEQVQALTNFTLDGIFFDVFNKVYESDACAVGYWLAPLADTYNGHISGLTDLVDMKAVEAVHLGRLKWTEGDQIDGMWTDKFLCDPRNGKFHYFSGAIAPGVSIFDPVPDSVPNIAQKGRKNIIDFSDSFWKASKKKFTASTYDARQPVMHAELLMSRRNFLDTGSEKECRQILCMIAPQPLEMSRLEPRVAAACLVWPVIIHRLEAYMITLEAFDKLGLRVVPAELALEAFTKDEDSDESESQVHFSGERGMGKNYERLEFIGDSLLKMMTTITVFLRTKCDEEGMHCRRMEILCNRRLFDVSTEKHRLYEYARASSFNRDTWYPENLVLLKGRGARTPPEAVKHAEKTQELGMKTIADISEAIVGAAVTATWHLQDTTRFDLGIQAITTLVDSDDHNITAWADIPAMYTPPDWSIKINDVYANRLAADIFSKTGYQFKHPRLLRSAFTHSSDTNATVPDLQRLEFLGDAVLDWVCISWLYQTNPTRNPQWLTEHKMAMVSNKFLAALAIVLDFDKFLHCTTTKLFADVTAYAMQVRSILLNIDGTKKRESEIPRDFWIEVSSPPKALSDLVESYLGAVLVDSNFTYSEIETFFTNHILWFFEDISKYDGFASRHPTSYLYKKFHDEFKCHNFRLLASEPAEGQIEVKITVGVMVHNTVLVTDEGSSGKYAKVRASKKALQIVEGKTIEEFRRDYGCDCHLVRGGD